MAKYRTYPAQRRAVKLAASAREAGDTHSAPHLATATLEELLSSAALSASASDPSAPHTSVPLRHRLRTRIRAMRHTRTPEPVH